MYLSHSGIPGTAHTRNKVEYRQHPWYYIAAVAPKYYQAGKLVTSAVKHMLYIAAVSADENSGRA